MALTGAGTQSNPYLIYTVQDLVDTYSYNGTGVHFKLMNDIALPYRDSRFPIPNFQGVFDGNGKKLTGLNIYLTNSNYIGMFSYITNATFKNLSIEGFNIIGKTVIGAIAGEAYENCEFENVIVGNYSFIQTYSQYSSSFHTAGGFIGYAYYPVTFRNCHNRNIIVKAYTNVGGFIGNGAGGSVYEQCYSYPLAGNMYAPSGGVGAWGNPNMQGSGGTSYYHSEQGLIDWYNGSTPLTDAQFLTQSAMPNFDWVNRWGMNADYNAGYPMPKAFLPVLEPPIIITTQGVSSYIRPIASEIAWVNVVHPIIKATHVGSYINPISAIYLNLVQEIVDRHTRVISSLGSINAETKRITLEKVINSVVSHLNQITGNYVLVRDIKPEIFENLVALLESGNDVDFIQHLINDVYINESRHSTINLQSQTEVSIVAYTGDTVTLKVQFKTYEDVAIEPTDVKLKIYQPLTQSDFELISTISLDQTSKTGIGEYQYTYTIPENLNNNAINFIVYEFSGMYNGQSTLARGKFSIRFV